MILIYCIKLEDVPQSALMYRYRACKDIVELADYLNDLTMENPTYEIRSVEITDNYVPTGEYVQFFEFEFNAQYFLTTLEARILAKHYEMQGHVA